MKKLLWISSLAISMAFSVAFSETLNAEGLSDCVVPDIYRFQATGATALAAVEDENSLYIYVVIEGRRDGRRDTVPVVYQKQDDSCEIRYINASGHDTPLEESISKDIADRLTEKATRAWANRASQ